MAFANLPPPSVRVWVATLADADVGLTGWLDDRERQRLARYDAEADRARFLLGAAMLRAAVGSELGIHPLDVPVDRACAACGRSHGRPVVPGTRLALSVSHGGLVVVLALGSGGPVGIDVERIGGRHVEDVRGWTRAEALFKAGARSGLLAHELTPPAAGHVLTLARRPGAAVRLLPASDLLSPRDHPHVESMRFFDATSGLR